MSLYLNFKKTFTNSWGHTKSFKFYLLNLIVIRKFLFIFLFKFELDVDSFGLRRGVDDSEVVSAIALVLNSPANSIFWASAMKFEFSGIVVVCIGRVEKSISNATFIIGKYHVPV